MCKPVMDASLGRRFVTPLDLVLDYPNYYSLNLVPCQFLLSDLLSDHPPYLYDLVSCEFFKYHKSDQL